MKVVFGPLLFACLLAKDALNSRVEALCKASNFDEVMKIDPKGVKYGGLKMCLRSRDISKDGQLATLIERFPDAMPTGRKLRKSAKKMYEYNMAKSLRALLGKERCFKLDKKTRKFFASQSGMDLAAVCKKGHGGGIVPGGTSPATGTTSSTQPSKAPVAAGPPIQGSVVDWDEHRVRETVDVLARISMEQANQLGHVNNACLGLTRAHFEVAGVTGPVVASLSIHCFRAIPAEAFAGLNAEMVRTMTAWPFARRAQIRAIRPEVIVALPFDQLGIGLQTKANAEKHACFGISREQMKAINKDSKAKKAYKSRCIRSKAAGGLVPNTGVLATCILLALYAVAF